MSEANDGPGTATVVVVAPSAEAPNGGSESGEVSQGLETAADAAVQIAQIEADTAITIAAIEADASIEHHEMAVEENAAMTEAFSNEELTQCRNRITELEAANTGLQTELDLLKALIPSPSTENAPPSPAEPEPAAVEEALAQVLDESPAAAPEPPPKPKPRHRWI
jgi:hypothetical protein